MRAEVSLKYKKVLLPSLIAGSYRIRKSFLLTSSLPFEISANKNIGESASKVWGTYIRLSCRLRKTFLFRRTRKFSGVMSQSWHLVCARSNLFKRHEANDSQGGGVNRFQLSRSAIYGLRCDTVHTLAAKRPEIIACCKSVAYKSRALIKTLTQRTWRSNTHAEGEHSFMLLHR